MYFYSNTICFWVQFVFPQIYLPMNKMLEINELHRNELFMDDRELYSSTTAIDYILIQVQGMRDRNIDRLYEERREIDDNISYILDESSY